jgi:hypothetical protein
MSKQGIGEKHTIPNVGTPAPAGEQGLDMALVNNGGRKPAKYRLSINVTSGTPIVSIYGAGEADGSDYGPLGDDGGAVPGALNSGVAFAAGYRHFILENLGGLRRFGVRLSAGAAAATLTLINENGD